MASVVGQRTELRAVAPKSQAKSSLAVHSRSRARCSSVTLGEKRVASLAGVAIRLFGATVRCTTRDVGVFGRWERRERQGRGQAESGESS
jgi:hypothetical protein